MQLGIVLLSAGWLGAFVLGLRLGHPTVALALFGFAALTSNYRALRSLRPLLQPKPVELAIGVGLAVLLVAATRLSFPFVPAVVKEEVGEMTAIGALSWELLPAVVVVIIAEELLWRGLALSAYRSRGPAVAIFLSTCLYAGAQLATGSWLVGLAAVGLGGVWAMVTSWRGNLWPALLSHAAWTLSTLGVPLV